MPPRIPSRRSDYARRVSPEEQFFRELPDILMQAFGQQIQQREANEMDVQTTNQLEQIFSENFGTDVDLPKGFTRMPASTQRTVLGAVQQRVGQQRQAQVNQHTQGAMDAIIGLQGQDIQSKQQYAKAINRIRQEYPAADVDYLDLMKDFTSEADQSAYSAAVVAGGNAVLKDAGAEFQYPEGTPAPLVNATIAGQLSRYTKLAQGDEEDTEEHTSVAQSVNNLLGAIGSDETVTPEMDPVDMFKIYDREARRLAEDEEETLTPIPLDTEDEGRSLLGWLRDLFTGGQEQEAPQPQEEPQQEAPQTPEDDPLGLFE